MDRLAVFDLFELTYSRSVDVVECISVDDSFGRRYYVLCLLVPIVIRNALNAVFRLTSRLTVRTELESSDSYLK